MPEMWVWIWRQVNILHLSILMTSFNKYRREKNAILSIAQGPVWAILFLRDALDANNIRFPEGMYFEDNPFALMCVLYFNSIYCLDETLYTYFINKNGIVHSDYKSNKERDYTRAMIWLLDEIKKRPDYEELWSKFRYEIESRFLWTGHFSPLNAIFKEIDWYKKELLEYFPNILESPYVTNITDEGCLEKIKFLK